MSIRWKQKFFASFFKKEGLLSFMGKVAIVGAGPAGLMAAETLAAAGHQVTVFDRMVSPGRKLLLAGRGGLNLTHTEEAERFLARYGKAVPWMAAALEAFSPADLVRWCEGLGEAVFTGSSGRVFPRAMKAAPLLRAWLRRLEGLEVRLALRHRWVGWRDGALAFEGPEGAVAVLADAAVFALGGASWPRMGSDGTWSGILAGQGVRVAAFEPSNCGVRVGWRDEFRERFEGQPLKRVAVSVGSESARGEAVITQKGLEGGVIYALSHAIRRRLAADGVAELRVDLRPDVAVADLARRVEVGGGARSLSNVLRQGARLSPASSWLVREAVREMGMPWGLAAVIKGVPIRVIGVAGLERAISSAGGVGLEEVDPWLMLRRMPGVFLAGEMLDWEAPTGGYLLQACFSTGVLAGLGVQRFLAR